ncbi:MAG: glycosyltransferase family 39 protein [Polyangiaceae bacterium]
MTIQTSSDSHLGQVQKSHPKTLDARHWLGWFAVLAIASWMYLYGIGHEPLWLDETYSYSMVQRGFLGIVVQTTRDVHPPLYYLLLKLGTLVLGTSPVALRIPSVLAALGLIALARFPVRRFFGDRTAYAFALLVALSPGFVCFAQEARMYTLAAFFVTGASVYGRLALERGRKADFLYFGLCTWAAAMTHNFGLVAVGMNGLYVVITARSRYRESLRRGVPRLARRGSRVLAMAHSLGVPSCSRLEGLLDPSDDTEALHVRAGRSLYVQVRRRALPVASLGVARDRYARTHRKPRHRSLARQRRRKACARAIAHCLRRDGRLRARLLTRRSTHSHAALSHGVRRRAAPCRCVGARRDNV